MIDQPGGAKVSGHHNRIPAGVKSGLRSVDEAMDPVPRRELSMSANLVRMICPNLRCRSILAVPIGLRGKSVRCRACGSRVSVPPAAQPAGAGATGRTDRGTAEPIAPSADAGE